jgi:class 3 adenylate cyclase
LALFVSVAIALFFSTAIAKAIRKIANAASLVGKFDLQHIDQIPPSYIKELNEQANSFNAMLEGLRSFETYVPRALVMRLIKKGGNKKILSEERELTVMFTDIVGFTSISEGRPAPKIADFLNEHLSILSSCVEGEDGTIDKFIGDALMAFWGAPEEQKDTAERACRAALAMATAIKSDNTKRKTDGKDAIQIRIGIHTGPVVVGNIGAPGRVNYTIVGDTVNAAQRLESLGNTVESDDDVTILISGTTRSYLDYHYTVNRLGYHGVKGKSEEIEVFRLIPGTTKQDYIGGGKDLASR